MKKILIVSKALDIGGIESALVNMANELHTKYQIDLLLYNPEGKMHSRLHKNIRILEPSWKLRALGIPLTEALRSSDWKMKLFRIFVTVWAKLIDNRVPVAIAAHSQPKLTGYDIAIAYHHEMGRHTVASGFSRVVDQCVEAKQKFAWLHFDSASIDLDSDYNISFYRKMDRIVCVSQSLKKHFLDRFPELSAKTDWCYNFLDFEALQKRSSEIQTIPYPQGKRICFSACRLAKEKALIRAIHCIAPVFRAHEEWLWYIAGEGPEREDIEKAIQEERMEQRVILLGNQENPYPYMRNADLLMNVSYHEAAPMVFWEAKALRTPVFATKTSSAVEMLPVGAFLCENTEQGISEALRFLAENPYQLDEAKLALQNHTVNNAKSFNKFEQWLENEEEHIF